MASLVSIVLISDMMRGIVGAVARNRGRENPRNGWSLDVKTLNSERAARLRSSIQVPSSYFRQRLEESTLLVELVDFSAIKP